MSAFDHLSIDPQLDLSLAQQLRQQLLWLIASGELRPGERLLPVRELAGRLGINLHTVRDAYHKLEADGLVETRRGRGTRLLPFDGRSLARIAATSQTHTVGVILPSVENPFYHALLQGVEDVAHGNGVLLFVSSTHDAPALAARYYAQMAVKQVDGIIVASHDIACFVPAPGAQPLLPTVAVDWPAAGPSVLLDLEGAGWQATRHLLEHGHRRVGLITVEWDAPNIAAVDAGYVRALDEAGMTVDPSLIVRAPGFGMAVGAEAARRLLALPKPPSAIFAIADMLALGALTALKAAGVRVPEQMALVGFNDIPTAALVDPPLTTVAAPVREMGAAAMTMLQELIAGRTPARSRLVLPTVLVVRQSCGCHAPAPRSQHPGSSAGSSSPGGHHEA